MYPPLFLLTVLLSPPDSYPRPELLTEPAGLAKSLPAGKVHVLDAQSKVGYAKGHIPGAVWVDVGAWKQAFRDGKDREGWAKRVGALGIAPDSCVVIYDNSRNNEAARVWWILRYWGFRDVRLLNGGWKGWLSSGGKVEKTPAEPKPVAVKLNPQPGRLATKEQVKEGLADRGQVLDARSAAEYRAGCIPGAVRL